MSDQSSGDVNVAVSEDTTTGGNMSFTDQTEGAAIKQLRVSGNPLHTSFTWREDDDADPVVVTRDWTDVPSGRGQEIMTAALRSGIRMESVTQ